jgi:hypothetical protein
MTTTHDSSNNSKAADVEQTLTVPPCNSNAASFFDSEDFSDCEVVIGADGRAISCHKFALSAASAVFRAMFVSSDMLEATSGKLVIKDAEPAIVKLLLRHMYGIEVQVPMQQVRCCRCCCYASGTATQPLCAGAWVPVGCHLQTNYKFFHYNPSHPSVTCA